MFGQKLLTQLTINTFISFGLRKASNNSMPSMAIIFDNLFNSCNFIQKICNFFVQLKLS